MGGRSISTLVALVLASTLTDGLTISGATTWVLGTLIVWIVTALGTWLLPLFVFKTHFTGRQAQGAANAHPLMNPLLKVGSRRRARR